jgi:hypothetical protein
MRPRPVYIGVFIAVILGIYEHPYFSEPACAKTRFANQQIVLKLKKHHAEGHDVIIGQILPWLVRIDSLSPDDPDGPLPDLSSSGSFARAGDLESFKRQQG